MPIKLLAFDIGGVLATINKTTIQKTFGPKANYEIFGSSFSQLQRGLIKPCTYLEKISSRLEVDKPIFEDLFLNMIQVHDNAILLKNLKCPYIFASNINILHYQKFIGVVKPNKFTLLNSALSYQLEALKPEATFFESLVFKAKIKPAQIIFIDDKVSNIKAASTAGLVTAWCKKPEFLEAFLVAQKLMVKPRPT